jgi:hypothetical protein
MRKQTSSGCNGSKNIKLVAHHRGHIPSVQSGATTATDRPKFCYDDPCQWDDHGCSCCKPHIESCSISTAGQPISQKQTHPLELHANLESCGNLANPHYMEAAKLMMMTGLSVCWGKSGTPTKFFCEFFTLFSECNVAYQYHSTKAKYCGTMFQHC